MKLVMKRGLPILAFLLTVSPTAPAADVGRQGRQGMQTPPLLPHGDEPHPRRYWPIWKRIWHGTYETYDLGVYDPTLKEPQHDPRLPY